MTQEHIILRPALSYAVWKSGLLIGLSLAFLVLAWTLSPLFVFGSLAMVLAAVYRIAYLRSFRYEMTPAYIRFSAGLLFRRTDVSEYYRIKGYIQTRSLVMQLLGLMNLTLKGTDPDTLVVTLTGIPVSDLVDELRERVQAARASNRMMEINRTETLRRTNFISILEY